jgi:hypothetical protein
MKPGRFVVLAVLVAAVAYLALNTDKSDWRYPRLLLKQAPKMPFRYFV